MTSTLPGTLVNMQSSSMKPAAAVSRRARAQHALELGGGGTTLFTALAVMMLIASVSHCIPTADAAETFTLSICAKHPIAGGGACP